ncbi:oxidoreductase [Noviherbaspirillum cavernae]|uniref:Oxidoreductase n=1 Tax=Noviherbaspirillum cavernae TaxID=2320862 RepID=A0A418WW36_9BURK|nr:PDR/VanB family oxidoreductase [Noviherbaspirillum cavernae]RJF96926.1 oxidoreductase [Noviherbaspirillum cavernae]
MNTIDVKVVSKSREAEDIFSFELAAAGGAALPAFNAGAHIDVHVGGGVVRQYSLCNDAEEKHRYRIAVLRDPKSRGGSIAMHDRIHAGDVIRISAPRNHFPLQQAERSLLFAGGIGITPILCMAAQLARQGADFEMHYCTRSRERTAFLELMGASPYADRVHLHFDDGPPEQKLDLPAVLGTADAGKHLYVCGPTGFIDYVTGTARQSGWGKEQIHLEYFGAAQQGTSGDATFEVKIASTGQCFEVPADKTVFSVLDENGIAIPVSCEQGVCGTCITRVLDGVPDHRDLYFTDEEKAKNDQFTPCCSRARSRTLVLDL